ncbi:MAG: hypothetical protein M1434_11755 [Chloroflexi bacterium]|nr:hypothetical protein [Chloroflexota bacterium]
MTEIQLIAPSRDLLAVTRVLAGQGVFHQVDASSLSSQPGISNGDSWPEQAASYATLERRVMASMQALNVEAGPPPAADRAVTIEVDVARPQVEQIEQDVKNAGAQLAGEQKRLEQLHSTLMQLEPLAGIDLDLATLGKSHYMFYMLGVMPAGNLERIQTSLARIPFVLMTLRKDRQNAVVWLAGTQHNADVLDRAARSAYLNPLNLPDTLQGTPSQVIESLHAEIKRTQQAINEQNAVLSSLRKTHQQQMQTLIWRVRASRMLAEAMARFGKLRYTYLMVGWAPTANVENLTQRLRQASPSVLLETTPINRSDTELQNVPVSLRNPGILGAFQMLVTTYARPRYGELDPTWLITLTFPLLFGAMFGDVGHGLVLALLGALVVSRRIPALRSMASLGAIVTACGLSATMFGFLYGSIFGVENALPALWIRPMQNIMEILLFAIGAGVILLSIGFVLSMYNSFVARDWGKLLFDHNGLAGFVLYWSLIGLAGGALAGLHIPAILFIIPAVAAGVCVMLSESLSHLIANHHPLVEGGIGTYAVQAVFELFETLIGFLSNSLSYVRVGAFAVAHGGLSAVVFILAGMVSHNQGLGYWIVIALGNLFIVGFEGLIVGIQTMRLEYYEFFSKFFTGGGTRYKPMTLLPVAED